MKDPRTQVTKCPSFMNGQSETQQGIEGVGPKSQPKASGVLVRDRTRAGAGPIVSYPCLLAANPEGPSEESGSVRGVTGGAHLW